jgi:phasin
MASAPKKTAAVETQTVAKEIEAAAFSAPEFNKAVEAASAPVAEIQENVRKVVEKTVSDAREAYAKAKSAAEEATGALETSFAAAKTGLVEINTKALEAIRANVEANFDFVHSLVGAKSVSDLVALQTEFTRKQIETVTGQAKEFGALAQKVANDSTAPIKDQVAKSFKIAI